MTTHDKPQVLIFGGTGAVGSRLIYQFKTMGVQSYFTYHQSADKARILEMETGAKGIRVDLANEQGVESVFHWLKEQNQSVDVLIYAAVHTYTNNPLELSSKEWELMERINCESPWKASLHFAQLNRAKQTQNPPQIIFLTALDRTQSLPLPSAFAGTQGKLNALAMALAKELGPQNICVNTAALGLLNEGLGKKIDPHLVEDYLAFSSLRRLGTTDEVAQTISTFALTNSYMTGRTFAINGGI